MSPPRLFISAVLFVLATFSTSPVLASPLQVYLVPHSHCDIAWVESFDEYYTRNVSVILDGVVASLTRDPSRVFNWAEIGFFARWWKTQNATTRVRVKEFITQGRWEFVGGGWSQNDEAVAHFSAVIDQLSLGHQFLKEHVGVPLEALPRVGWQIDPFGSSAVTSVLFARSGFDAAVYDRINIFVKQNMEVVAPAGLEFVATPLPLRNDSATDVNILSHLFGPYRYCTPPGFDFEGDPKDNPPITSANVAERAETFVQNLRGRHGQYRSDVLLVPFGCDFKFQKSELMFTNMERLVSYINANASDYGMQIHFSTVSEYFRALRATNTSFPVYKSDFLPYATNWASDHGTMFWAGFYSTREWSKQTSRLEDAVLRHGEVFTTIANSDEVWGANVPRLMVAREQQGLMQHHDSITGTSKGYVMADMQRRLVEGIGNASTALAHAATALLQKNAKDTQHVLSYDPSVLASLSKSVVVPLVLSNSLAQPQTSRVVSIPVPVSGVTVLNSTGGVVACDVLPRLPWRPNDAVRNTSSAVNAMKYEVYFPASVPGFGLSTYYLSTSSSAHPAPRRILAAGESVSNGIVTATFSKETNLLSKLSSQGSSIDLTQFYMNYTSQFEGAYMFGPDSQAVEAFSTPLPAPVVHEGDVVTRVSQRVSPYIEHVMHFYAGADFVEFTSHVGPLPNTTVDVITRFNTSLDTNRTIVTDDSGLLDMHRTYVSGVRQQIAANYYPQISSSYIRGKSLQLSLVTRQPVGVSAQFPGSLEAMLHRRSTMDDAKGLGEPLNDTHAVAITHRIALGTIADNQAVLQRRRITRELNAPLQALFASEPVSEPAEWSKVFELGLEPLASPTLPEQVYVQSLRVGVDNTVPGVLLRFINLAQPDETTGASKNGSASVDLSCLFSKLKLCLAREVSLTGVMPVASAAERTRWPVDGQELDRDGRAGPATAALAEPTLLGECGESESQLVHLQPLDMRTFWVGLC